MKKTLLATSALALVAASASAVDVEMYGQVNKGIFAFDDGVSTDVVIVDNDKSSTRIGLKGSQVLDNGLTASVLFETELQSNASNTFTQANFGATPAVTTPVDADSGDLEERHARVGIAGNFGGIFIGQQSTATDAIALQDLAGAGDVMDSGVADIGGGLQFRNSATGAAAGTVGSLVGNMDGPRDNSIRYDSPIVNGFQGRVAASQGGDVDAGVFYDGAFEGFKVKGALGYQMNGDRAAGATAADSTLSGSVSVAMDNGLAATLAAGSQALENEAAGQDDPMYYYAKVGYSWDQFEVAADYGNYENFNVATAADEEASTFGLAAQMNMGHGVSLSALYRNFDADITGTDTDSIDLYGVNMRVKF